MKYSILLSLVSKVDEKLDKMKSKLSKYGSGELIVGKSEPYLVKEDTDSVGKWFVDIDVTGSDYKVGDYSFVASLEWNDEASANIVKKADPDAIVPEKYFFSTACEHCKTNRQRKRTILLLNNVDNTYIQVGNQCVKDFIGVNIESYLGYLSIFDSIGEYMESIQHDVGFAHSDIGFILDDILLQTLEEVNHCGYISQRSIDNWYANNDYEDAECPLVKTSSQVWLIMNETRDREGEIIRKAYQITEESKEKLQVVKDYINNLEATDDYIHNIQSLLKTEHIKASDLGLVVSIVGFYLRQLANKEKTEKESVSKHIGNVGEKITFISKPEVVTTVENEYGLSTLYKFLVDNNIVTWWTGKTLDPEENYQIKATIKAHEIFRGVAQTVITRGRVI